MALINGTQTYDDVTNKFVTDINLKNTHKLLTNKEYKKN